jgi:hypothetical protein
MEPIDKSCLNCRYINTDEDDLPCRNCFDSFCEKKFSAPSSWEPIKEAK